MVRCSGLVPEGAAMRERPTVVLLHGGPGSYDHSYFKPDFAPLTRYAQVVYLDLRNHGRSARHDPAGWTFEVCADDVRAFCDILGIAKPIVYGHSMGGFVAMLYGARHPGHAAGLVLQSTNARFDLARLVEGFRRCGGDDVAELARRDYGGDPVTMTSGHASSPRLVRGWRRVARSDRGSRPLSMEGRARTLLACDAGLRGPATGPCTLKLINQSRRRNAPQCARSATTRYSGATPTRVPSIIDKQNRTC